MASATVVPIIVFSLLFGVALRIVINETGNDSVLTFIDQIQRIVLTMIRLVMKIAPIGVVLLLLMFVAVIAVRTRLNPMLLPGKLAEQTAIAVTTTSSAVTYPTVLRTAIEKVGISQRMANFTLSVGLTMGSCEAVLNYMIVIMFLAQAGNVQLSFGQIMLGMGLAILLNLATITVPGGFPVVVIFLGASLDLPLEAVGLLIAVDWFAGILRTFMNVNGDTLVAMLVANPSDDIDRDVYYGKKEVTADTDVDDMKDVLAKADTLD